MRGADFGRTQSLAHPMILELIQTVALLLALSLLHGFSTRTLAARPRLAELASGLIFGSVCLVGMMVPINLAPGVIVDGRSVLLSMAALFGGPVTGLVAGAMASICAETAADICWEAAAWAAAA